MSRNCNVVASVGDASVQLRPPSTVRSTTPSYPLIQATFRLTGDSPRKCDVLPVGSSFHAGVPTGSA